MKRKKNPTNFTNCKIFLWNFDGQTINFYSRLSVLSLVLAMYVMPHLPDHEWISQKIEFKTLQSIRERVSWENIIPDRSIKQTPDPWYSSVEPNLMQKNGLWGFKAILHTPHKCWYNLHDENVRRMEKWKWNSKQKPNYFVWIHEITG